MLEVITNPIYEKFMLLCANTKKSIKLCAPYIKADVFSDLLDAKNDTASIDLITKINLRDYHNKVSDLDAVRQTLHNGGNVYNCSNLHAKVYIFDDSQCIITSANLSASGFKRNAECGLLTDDMTIVNSSLEFYNNVMIREDVGKINGKKLDEISNLLEKIPPAPRIEYPRLDLSKITIDRNLSAISNNLSGWKREVFISLGQFDEIFTTADVSIIAQQLQEKYPRNNNREAKVRQILQQLRDLGLVEFSAPGIYKKLWV